MEKSLPSLLGVLLAFGSMLTLVAASDDGCNATDLLLVGNCTSTISTCEDFGFPDGGTLECLWGECADTSGCLRTVFQVDELTSDPLGDYSGSFTIDYPAKTLRIEIAGEGDADLYVAEGYEPNFLFYGCRPYLASSNEACIFTPGTGNDFLPRDTPFYYLINAWNGPTTFSNVTLRILTDRYDLGITLAPSISPQPSSQPTISAQPTISVKPSSSPTPAPTVNLWQCTENTGSSASLAPYTCTINPFFRLFLGITESGAKLDPAIDDLFIAAYFCDEPIGAGDPTRDKCRDICTLGYFGPNRPDSAVTCTDCMLTEDPEDPSKGVTAYDCRSADHLIAEQNITTECTLRDANGDCGATYQHWICIRPTGDGFSCSIARDARIDPRIDYSDESISDGLIVSPVFPYDKVPYIAAGDDTSNIRSGVIIYCSNDIGGFSLDDCEDPLCVILEFQPENVEDVPGVCTSCTMFNSSESPKGFNFAYDCSNFANLSCPVLDTNGDCQEPTVSFNDFFTDKLEEKEDYNPSANDDSDDQLEWVLKNISPTGFNVLSDIFAYITRFIVGLAIAALYPFILTIHMRRGHPIPISYLGSVPGDFFTATWNTRAMRYSGPAFSLIVLFALADFSHSIADIGLGFQSLEERGGPLPVLILTTDKRNKAYPIQLSGDPLYSRTSALQYSPALTRTSVSNTEEVELAIEKSRVINELTDSFFSSVLLMARGQSPFIDTLDPDLFDRTTDDFVGTPRFINRFNRDDLALASIPQAIPIECDSSELVSATQYLRGTVPFETFLRSDDFVPNCTFTEERQSGIHQASGEFIRKAEILELSSKTVGLITGDEVLLQVNGSAPFRDFEATPDSKRLARDRSDWRNGREFFDVDTILMNGGKTAISLGKVVLGTGPDLGLDRGDVTLGDQESFTQQRQYGLVAEIADDCPERPSGLPTNGTVCYAIITIDCDLFEEDVAPYVHEVYYPLRSNSECKINSLTMVWGRGFDADATLITVMGGIYGAMRPQLWDGTDDMFARHGALAALFAMANVEERPSISSKVFPVVNVVYIFFMILPVVLSVIVIVGALLSRRMCLDIPTTSWELMVTAKENSHLFPERSNKIGNFPKEKEDIVLVFHDALEQHEEADEDGMRKASTKKGQLELIIAPSRTSGKTGLVKMEGAGDIEQQSHPKKKIARCQVIKIIEYEDGSEERIVLKGGQESKDDTRGGGGSSNASSSGADDSGAE